MLSKVGNPLWSDDVTRMCFNPVKNYQVAKRSNAWFQTRHITAFNSGTVPGTHWRGKLGTSETYLIGYMQKTTLTIRHPL